MSDVDAVDYFSHPSVVTDPYPYYEAIRTKSPVHQEPHYGVLAVTGYEEAVEVYRDSETFSSCNAMSGPFVPLPPAEDGETVDAVIERGRAQLPMNEYMVTQDGSVHEKQRVLLRKLLTPKRLKENEEFMWRLADQQIDDVIKHGTPGKFELLGQYAQPFALLVIADLLGVPEEDLIKFRVQLAANDLAVTLDGGANVLSTKLDPLEFLNETFTRYVEDRRRNPQNDVLTDLATTTYDDGSIPEVADVVHVATFLFAAGQETTARLITSAMHILVERPDIQQRLRDEPKLIPEFLEEALRVESPVKTDFRLARRDTVIGGVEVPAGSNVALLNGAINRDPRQFEDPAEFRFGRPNYRSHLAFGRGNHACPGAPLARVESRVSFERLLARMADIRISEAEHGPADDRRFEYDPVFVLRGLSALHLEYTPVEDA